MTLLHRRAPARPATWDDATRSVEATLATRAEVRRTDVRGPYLERLDVSAGAWEAAEPLPLLDAHRQELAAVVGSVDRIREQGGVIVARLTFREGSPAAELVRDGVVRGISIGYRVQRWTDTVESGRRVRTAVRWQIIEASVVVSPADANAAVRCEEPMDETESTPPDPVIEERERITEIQRLATRAGAADLAASLIEAGASVERARAAILDRVLARGAPRVEVRAPDPARERQERWEAIGEALHLRAGGAGQPSEAARPWMHRRIADVAAEVLGERPGRRSDHEVIVRALHTTSDFPEILGNAVGRSLRAGYQAAPAGIRTVARVRTVRDFRVSTRVALSAAPVLLPVGEGGEIRGGTLAEAAEGGAARRFGRQIQISVEALVNDDLQAFAGLATRMGLAAAELEAQLLADRLTEGSGLGPVMSDGKRLFHADHQNLAASGAGLSLETLAAARTAMRRQKGLQGEPISVVPRFLVVPPELEVLARQLVTQITPARVADVPAAAADLEVVVEPRLAAPTAWYLAADPAVFDGLELLHVDGLRGPTVTSERDFDTGGLRLKVEATAGAAVIDWRGLYRAVG